MGSDDGEGVCSLSMGKAPIFERSSVIYRVSKRNELRHFSQVMFDSPQVKESSDLVKFIVQCAKHVVKVVNL
ncbi:hypothetical protein EPI10_005217 [Gossypium australe]|uniref:Uncharacterized protein n=1 Tax=Gossypium australe TaxID=47621 RepID=A0A5B6WPS0_9ROSI|nr:hypothetical protein EPI10_005217 [Gossypium australe]